MTFSVETKAPGVFVEKVAREQHAKDCTPVRDAINNFLTAQHLKHSNIVSEEVHVRDYMLNYPTKTGLIVETTFSVHLEDPEKATGVSDADSGATTHATVSLMGIEPSLTKKEERDVVKGCLKEAYAHALSKVEAIATAGASVVAEISSIKELTQGITSTASVNAYGGGTSSVRGGSTIKAGKLHFSCSIEMQARVEKNDNPLKRLFARKVSP